MITNCNDARRKRKIWMWMIIGWWARAFDATVSKYHTTRFYPLISTKKEKKKKVKRGKIELKSTPGAC